MFTFEEAVEQYKTYHLKNLFGLLRRYENIYTDEQPFFCPYCGWYYPHDNWRDATCPKCNNIIQQVDNRYRQLGFLSLL